MARPHLLYLAFFFPPSRSSGVYRALATVKAFDRAGWDVTVVTTSNRFFEEEIGSVDDSLLEAVPTNVRLERVEFSFRPPELNKQIRDLGWVAGNLPVLMRGLRSRTKRARDFVDVMRGRSGDSYDMDDRYLAWIEPVVARARSLAQSTPFDHVLATGNPYSSFEAARIISAMHDVPYTIDYRDPWAFDMRTGGLARLSPQTFSAERRIIEEAHACVHVNEAIKEAYSSRYSEFAEKQHVVVNGFDSGSIPPLAEHATGEGVIFGMLGTVTDLWPLAEIFEAWGMVRSSLPSGSRLRLGGHLGYFAWSAEALESTFPGRDEGFEYVGAVPKTDVASFYSEVDVALVPLFGGPMVTAGKVLEVAALGVPIVCVQREDGGGRRFYRSHPLAFGVDPDPDSIATAMKDAAKLASELDVDRRTEVREQMGRWERLTAMRDMVSIVESSVEHRP